jgi:hypothetical protein
MVWNLEVLCPISEREIRSAAKLMPIVAMSHVVRVLTPPLVAAGIGCVWFAVMCGLVEAPVHVVGPLMGIGLGVIFGSLVTASTGVRLTRVSRDCEEEWRAQQGQSNSRRSVP